MVKADSGQCPPGQTKRGDASSCSSVEEDGGRDENDSKPSLVTGSAAPAQTKRLFKKKQQHPVKVRPFVQRFFYLEFHRGNFLQVVSCQKEMYGVMKNWTYTVIGGQDYIFN
jgi:hypothetical protein